MSYKEQLQVSVLLKDTFTCGQEELGIELTPCDEWKTHIARPSHNCLIRRQPEKEGREWICGLWLAP